MIPFSQDGERRAVSEQAARWVAVLSDGAPADQPAFVAWLKQSPRHVEEFLLVSATAVGVAGSQRPKTAAGEAAEIDRIVAEALAAKPLLNVVAWTGDSAHQQHDPHALEEATGPQTLEDPPTAQMLDDPRLDAPSTTLPTKTPAPVADIRQRYFPRRPYGLAGIAAALLLVVCGVLGAPRLVSLLGPTIYSTALGEQRTVRLPDGSIVSLNTNSRIAVDFSAARRDLRLLEGEAVFKVERDTTRPFRVHTGDAVVQALGTQFNIYRRASGTTVAVLEGRVRVSGDIPTAVGSGEASPAPAVVFAGEEVEVVPTGKVVKSAAPDIAAAVAWRQRRLVFRAERLADIAAEFRRYSPHHILPVDDIARDRQVTGTFDADDPGSLVLFLVRVDGLHVDRNGDDFIVRGRRVAPSP